MTTTRAVALTWLLLTILLSACAEGHDGPSGDGQHGTSSQLEYDAVRSYSIADGIISFELPSEVRDERDAPRFSLNPDQEAERDAYMDEEVVVFITVVPRQELLRDAPQTRPALINEILESGSSLSTEVVWQSVEERPQSLKNDPQVGFPESIAPVQACSATIGVRDFSAGIGGTDGRGVHRNLLAYSPGFHVVVYIDEKLVRLSLLFVSLPTDGYSVLGELDDFFQVEDGDLFWQSADSPQAFYESLQAGELNHPKLTLFQESWEMLLSTLEFDCP